MSLSKQLMLLLSLVFLLIFIGNFAAGLSKMRDYVQVESKAHAQDTATSLGLSLSPHLADPRDPILETMIRAIYDMGYYEEIRLTDIDGKVLVRFNDSRVFERVPRWFTKLLPMEAATATSEINSGWNLAAIVSVSINPGYAYLRLYQQMTGAAWYSLAALLLSLLLLSLVLRFTLQPLRHIDRLARQIATGMFPRIETLPWTTEVRNVAVSMNVMSAKLEGVISGLNQRLDSLSQRLMQDEVTALYGRRAFDTDMENLFITSGRGYVAVVRINDFAEQVRAQDAVVTDRFLKRFADILSQCAKEHDAAATAYRFYGSEFALVMPGLRRAAVEPFAQYLRQRLTWLGEQYQKPDIVHIGIVPFNPEGTTEGILAAGNDACEQAGLIGVSSYFICRDTYEGKTTAEWREVVFQVVDSGSYTVSYIGQVEDLRSGDIIMDEAFIKTFDAAGEPVAVGLFVSLAEKFHRIVEVDQTVTGRVLDRLRAGAVPHRVAINLSLATLRSAEFRVWLIDCLRLNASLAERLVFAVTAYSAAKDIPLLRDFIAFVHRYGARILIKRYDTQHISIETMKSLRPDYLRLGRDLTAGSGSESGKRLWLETMKEVGDLLGISVIAEQVEAASDLTALKQIGLAGASRSAVPVAREIRTGTGGDPG